MAALSLGIVLNGVGCLCYFQNLASDNFFLVGIWTWKTEEMFNDASRRCFLFFICGNLYKPEQAERKGKKLKAELANLVPPSSFLSYRC